MGKAYALAGPPLLRLASPIVLLRAGTVALSSFLIARQRQELKLLPLGIVTLLRLFSSLCSTNIWSGRHDSYLHLLRVGFAHPVRHPALAHTWTNNTRNTSKR